MKLVCSYSGIMIIVFLAAGCFWRSKEAFTLQDLAYQKGNKTIDRVFIKEDGTPVPYLVLSKEYNGNCLLLREFLLDQKRRYNEDILYGAYYEESEIDEFLNHDFYETLSPNIKDIIIDSSIIITAKESLGIGGKDTITINRKVFLLSYTELNVGMLWANLKEGEPLLYFKQKSNRVAYMPTGSASIWWLRTASFAHTNVVYVVDPEGYVNSGGIASIIGDNHFGVRPAFCLNRETPVQLVEINGAMVYTVK